MILNLHEWEEWKWIDGFEGIYEISTLGRIFSHIGARNPKNQFRPGFRNPQIISHGYKMVWLYKSGKRIHRLVHQLVCEAFIGARHPNTVVNHKNGVKHDNRLSNLEYCSYSDNVRHAIKNGLQIMKKGSECWSAKLDDGKIEEILSLLNSGYSQKEVAKKYGVYPSVISRIKSGLAWKHLTRKRG